VLQTMEAPMRIDGTGWNRTLSNALIVMLLAFFALAEYSNLERAAELDQVCGVFPFPGEINDHPGSDRKQAEAICAQRLK
jgi:hypothetical protein